MRNPFARRRTRDAASWSPASPHPFQEARDASLTAFASGGGGSRAIQSVAPVAVTGAFARTAGCAVPGCGKASADPIHAPADA